MTKSLRLRDATIRLIVQMSRALGWENILHLNQGVMKDKELNGE